MGFEKEKIEAIANDRLASYAASKNSLFVKVKNFEDPKIKLGAVHTDFEDLSLLYYVMLHEEGDIGAAALVTESMLKRWGISQETLHDDAIASCENMYPSDLFDLSEFIGIHGTIPMIVVSNTKRMFGATALFYPGVVQRLSEKLGGNFIVLPSSIHEVIAVPDAKDVEGLAEMVKEINGLEVPDEDQLSDHVYRYDKEENRVRLVA